MGSWTLVECIDVGIGNAHAACKGNVSLIGFMVHVGQCGANGRVDESEFHSKSLMGLVEGDSKQACEVVVRLTNAEAFTDGDFFVSLGMDLNDSIIAFDHGEEVAHG